MTTEYFYRRIIIIISVLVILLGIFISFILDPKLIPVEGGIMVRWLQGIIGATLMGWGLTILLVSWYAFKQGIPQLLRYILLGLIAWFIPDTIISIYYGIVFNVIINLIFLAVAGFPLYLSQKVLNGITRIYAWD